MALIPPVSYNSLVEERIEEYRGWQEFRLNLNQFMRTDGEILTRRSKGGGVLKEGGRGLLLELQCTTKRLCERERTHE